MTDGVRAVKRTAYCREAYGVRRLVRRVAYSVRRGMRSGECLVWGGRHDLAVVLSPDAARGVNSAPALERSEGKDLHFSGVHGALRDEAGLGRSNGAAEVGTEYRVPSSE